MGKYLITGSPGSGKSSAIQELHDRGFSAYDTDSHPGATVLQDNHGNKVPFPAGAIDWDAYQWNWQDDVISSLLTSDDIVFLGGIASNSPVYYPEFDVIFVLTLDNSTLRQRILGRTDKDYAKHPEQLRGELAFRPVLQERLLKLPNSVEVDATTPLNNMVDYILENI